MENGAKVASIYRNGKLVLGDPCLILSDEHYDIYVAAMKEKLAGDIDGMPYSGKDFCEVLIPTDVVDLDRSRILERIPDHISFAVGRTNFGDGTFLGNVSHTEFYVESGAIALIPEELFAEDKRINLDMILTLDGSEGSLIHDSDKGYFQVEIRGKTAEYIQTEEEVADEDDSTAEGDHEEEEDHFQEALHFSPLREAKADLAREYLNSTDTPSYAGYKMYLKDKGQDSELLPRSYFGTLLQKKLASGSSKTPPTKKPVERPFDSPTSSKSKPAEVKTSAPRAPRKDREKNFTKDDIPAINKILSSVGFPAKDSYGNESVQVEGWGVSEGTTIWISAPTGDRGPRQDQGYGENGNDWMGDDRRNRITQEYTKKWGKKAKALEDALKKDGYVIVNAPQVIYDEKGHVTVDCTIASPLEGKKIKATKAFIAAVTTYAESVGNSGDLVYDKILPILSQDILNKVIARYEIPEGCYNSNGRGQSRIDLRSAADLLIEERGIAGLKALAAMREGLLLSTVNPEFTLVSLREAADPKVDIKALTVTLLVDEHGWDENDAFEAVDNIDTGNQLMNWFRERDNNLMETAKFAVGTVLLLKEDEGSSSSMRESQTTETIDGIDFPKGLFA